MEDVSRKGAKTQSAAAYLTFSLRVCAFARDIFPCHRIPGCDSVLFVQSQQIEFLDAKFLQAKLSDLLTQRRDLRGDLRGGDDVVNRLTRTS
jgi:hypothetical protein